MRIDVLSLFPDMMQGALEASILGRAQAQGLLDIRLVNYREFTTDRHRTVDDYPFGGGAGMVLKPEPIFAAVESLMMDDAVKTCPPQVILLSPQGRVFTQRVAEELAQRHHLILISGHYEGYDERIREHLVDDEISIGDYVLTGGELPALVIIDAVSRLLPGVLGNCASAADDSFADGLLEFPQYTRPQEFRGWRVPEVLLSGHHERVADWRRRQSLIRTHRRRPDLLRDGDLSPRDRQLLRDMSDDKAEPI